MHFVLNVLSCSVTGASVKLNEVVEGLKCVVAIHAFVSYLCFNASFKASFVHSDPTRIDQMELISDCGRHVSFEGECNDSIWLKGNVGVLIAQAKHWASFAYYHTENI